MERRMPDGTVWLPRPDATLEAKFDSDPNFQRVSPSELVWLPVSDAPSTYEVHVDFSHNKILMFGKGPSLDLAFSNDEVLKLLDETNTLVVALNEAAVILEDAAIPVDIWGCVDSRVVSSGNYPKDEDVLWLGFESALRVPTPEFKGSRLSIAGNQEHWKGSAAAILKFLVENGARDFFFIGFDSYHESESREYADSVKTLGIREGGPYHGINREIDSILKSKEDIQVRFFQDF